MAAPLPFSSATRRLGAFILDQFILGGLGLVFAAVYIFLFFATLKIPIYWGSLSASFHGIDLYLSSFHLHHPIGLIFMGIFFIMLAMVGGLMLVIGYSYFLQIGPYQATWGMRIMGIKLVCLDGSRPSKQDVFWREVSYLGFMFFPFYLLICFFLVSVSKNKQAPHDMVRGTSMLNTLKMRKEENDSRQSTPVSPITGPVVPR